MKPDLIFVFLGIEAPKLTNTQPEVEAKAPEGDSDTHSSSCTKNEKGIYLKESYVGILKMNENTLLLSFKVVF